MVFDTPLILLFLGILVILFLVAMVVWGMKYAIAFAINSIIGYFALYAVKAFLLPSLIINMWSVAIVAVTGIFGFIIVLSLHGLAILF
jgi:hypothetical protein